MSRTPATHRIHIGHSPDPDDAFMWYPLASFGADSGPGGRAWTPRIDTGAYHFVHVLEDIQTLNERSERGALEITAISVHQYPYVADRYALTACGASLGDGYGPMVVAPRDRNLQVADLETTVLAVPGERTSAFLALSLLLGRRVPRYAVVPFDRIIPEVARGTYDAGLIIHEGQLTYQTAGLACVVDLGAWWTASRGLPLPLGANAIRRDLGGPAMAQICAILLASIRYALDHRDEAIAYALHYARDMGGDLADRFVDMYVNRWTLDYGPTGRQAVARFLSEASDAGLVPDAGAIDFVDPA